MRQSVLAIVGAVALLFAGQPSWAEDESDAAALVQTARRETGLTVERLTGELTRTTGQLRAFAGIVETHQDRDPILDVPTSELPAQVDIRRSTVALGPVAVWPASNFPLAFGVAGGDTASALAAGCPVVVKAHPSHPATSNRCAAAVLAALHETGTAVGWFSVLHAHSVSPGIALTAHPGVQAIAFTGSEAGGRALFNAAAARPVPIPVFAELGSINPMVITPAAIAERGAAIAAELAGSLVGSTGQLCTKPGLVLLVDGPQTEEFIAELSQALPSERAGVMLNSRLHDGFVTQARESAALAGVTSPVPPMSDLGERQGQRAVLIRTGSRTYRASAQLQREHFGPFAVIITCTDVDDLLDVLAGQVGSLTGTIHAGSAEPELARRIIVALARFAGRIVYNGFPTGVAVGWATVHGGPYPATTAAATTSVGMTAVNRFQRPIALQGVPDDLLPPELQDANPLGLVRRLNGRLTDAVVSRHLG